MIYFVWINLILVLSILPSRIKNIKSNFFVINIQTIIALLLFLIFFLFRDIHLGSDYEGYVSHYNMIIEGEYSIIAKHQEYLYRFLETIFTYFNLPYWIFFGFLYFMMYYFLFKGIGKFYFSASLIVFAIFVGGFFFFSLSAVRQSVAIAIFFFSIYYIIEKKLLNYVAIIIIASLFHLSALFLLPLYFINKIKFNSRLFIAIYLLSIVPHFQLYFYEFVVTILENIVRTVPYFSAYTRYMESSKLLSNINVNLGIGSILIMLINLIILLRAKKILQKNNIFKVYYILFFIGCITYNIFYDIELLVRLNQYFFVSFLVVFSTTIYYSYNSYEKIVSLILIMMGLILIQGRIYGLLSYL